MSQDAEFRCKITAYALRAAVSQRSPDPQAAALGIANIAVLAHSPAGQGGDAFAYSGTSPRMHAIRPKIRIAFHRLWADGPLKSRLDLTRENVTS